jgi:hypothetical protein
VPEIVTSVLQLEKRCIFCGNPPSQKNREHVIPQWLIELTGDPKRTWHLGVQYGDPERPARQFSANQYQFPACEACNRRYSDLEARTKANMTKLLDNQSLSAAEWDDFLDWFDKVRIGLFIGNMMLNKELPIPNPKFFIDQRIGTKDRCVLVYRLKDKQIGLRFIGASDSVFFQSPTSFVLVVNGMVFVNLSTDFLLASRMGFPYPRIIQAVEDRTRADDFTAHFRVKLPFIRFSFYPAVIAVYQTILNRELMGDETYAGLSAHDYVQTKTLPNDQMKTKLCVAENGKPVFLEPADKVVPIALGEQQTKTLDEYCIRFWEYRRHHLESLIKSGHVEAPWIKLARLMIKFNGYALDQTKSGTYFP